ncbi:hypothetical protein HID58_018808, partial [Brassica napus]
VVNVPRKGARKHPRGWPRTDILFICGGAFVDLEKAIVDRRQDSSIGFGAPVRANMANSGETSGGEFVGRFPILVSLLALTEDQLIRVLVEPKNALGKQYKKLFSKVALYRESAQMISKQAMVKNTGSRGLRALLESILTEAIFEIPDVNMGDERIDHAVIVDEGDSRGCTTKILSGDGAFECYLNENKSKDALQNRR